MLPFHGSYDPKKDIKIVKSAMAFQHKDGSITYIVMNISLWFGDSMDHSLFNGLIARNAGVLLCTDPYDPNRQLGIDLGTTTNGSRVSVPFSRRGNRIGVRTFKPTREEVLSALASSDNPGVVFLNPESDYPPTDPGVAMADATGSHPEQLEDKKLQDH